MNPLKWFKRNKKNPSGLPEVESYYAAEKKERAGLTWILAVVSIAAVLLVLLGLFFGGRWVYNKVRNDDPKPITTDSQETDTAETTPEQSGEVGTTDSGQDTDATDQAASTPGQSTEDLPNTGPTNLVTIFVLTSVAGTAAYSVRLRLNSGR
jgi:hypothetical protein